ncbi:unnamed protein product [Adineta steineri]|uniref:G-protein coupled receptors family 1 profile domain-containing protein n=1 Tax=Adineta steineri TaxID=433720 RepID=A0A814XRS6_9BILA|nr:unnamed protein product [Adineta steineri]CAF1608128.1 unnamed protein product [Adineta steineri]
MNNKTDCEIVIWSQQATKIVKPIFYICILATIIHLLFWIQFIIYPTVRQRSMQWLYAYLVTDLLLLTRFFVFYAYRWWSMCVPYFLRTIMCYCEAIFDNYLNLIQSYILLALNICRYLQIVYNHNVYALNHRCIIIAHILIYFLPLISHIILIKGGWSNLDDPKDDACDLLPTSLSIRLVFLLFSYVIPVTLALIFLLLSLSHIHNTDGIQTQQIVDARLKYHRQLIIQSSVFYSVWLILWSPHLLVFPFYHKSTTIGSIAQILNYINITVDPIVIAALDIRFLHSWTWPGNFIDRRTRRQRSVPVPVIMLSGPSDEIIEHSSNSM